MHWGIHLLTTAPCCISYKQVNILRGAYATAQLILHPSQCRPALCSLKSPAPEVVAGGSGRRFLALDGPPAYVLVATARDPAVYEYAGAMRQATNEWASGATAGRSRVGGSCGPV